MNEIYDFLKKCGTYYLATDDNGQPRVRPFGTIDLFDGGLYIQTGKVKPVAKQIMANPRIEICAFDGGTWLRLACDAKEDDRVEARKHMLDAYPNLRAMYDENDGNTLVLRLSNGTATFSSFTAPPKTIEF
ncbi:MAG: pyridoxamine 5'-phosphate oxidase family protein [Firmicutes bacterium]|nr:pyridoxamine 5'-phosphate oxidase family protein [Bacillota bacterium]